MRKYGKYEKMPDGTRAKQPPVKSMLLQTYFTSLLCLVLCVTMFFGTSYAWFTSEVNNTDNEIYIGTLDVGLFKENGTETPDNLADSDKKLFDSNIRWEPGYTSLETIQVVNEGDLAFKYTLDFTDGSGTDRLAANLTPEQLAAVAANFEVWVFNHQDKDHTYVKPNSYESITEANGWVNVGTLDEVLGDEVVLKDKVMATVRQDDSDTDENTFNGTTDGVRTTDRFTIALHMKEETNDITLMGNKITLSVKLVAYQLGSENDAFGNQYDEADYVTNEKELQEAIDNAVDGNVIRFANDIDGNVTVTQKPDVKITIDGNGKTFAGVILVDGKSATYTTAGLTIKNVKFKADSISADACIRLGDGTNNTRYTCNVTVDDCTFDVPGAVGVKSYTGGDKNLIITDCTATENAHSLVQAKGINGVLVENCNVKSKNGLNFNNSDNVTVNGCDVDVKGYAVRFGESSGGVGEAETYLIKNCTLKSAGGEGDAVIVLRGTADYATLTIENTTITGTPDITNTATDANVVKG